MEPLFYYASILAYFGSEEAIKAGLHLQWFERGLMEYDDSGQAKNVSWLELWTPDGKYFYNSIEMTEFHIAAAARYRSAEENAIQQQLNTFKNAYNTLQNTAGLLFHIETDVPAVNDNDFLYSWIEIIDGAEGTTRVTERIYEGGIRYETGMNAVDHELTETDFPVLSNREVYGNYTGSMPPYDYFRTFLVYYLITTDNHIEQSNAGMYFFDYGYVINNGAIYLAFDGYTINVQNSFYSAVSAAYVFDFSIIAASAVLLLGLIIVLLVIAGRKYILVDGKPKRAEGVHFSLIDKPYWDLGLAILIFWVILIIFTGLYIIHNVIRINVQPVTWQSNSVIMINIILAATVILIVNPALFWLMSFVKRIKAGGFWKHTLIYVILYYCLLGFMRFFIRKVKSLWAGLRLTFKVSVISAVAFCMMLLVGLIGTEGAGPAFVASLILTAVTAVCLLLYARRIQNLEKGASAVSGGDYDFQINAGSGELGSIANSINNISAGINTAVEQRMKSERLKTELITNVSHDIRTPLTSIITYTDLLDHEGLDNEKAPEYLEILKMKSLRLKTLTDELFEAAKAATGNIDVNLTELNIVSLINQVLGELDSAIKSSGLDLRINLPDKLHARADGRLMQRILENLMSNVFKYSMPGSRVYIDALETDASQVRIEIKNISSQELNFDPSELTERFKRGDDSRADGGSGLGLSIVQSFVDALGGKFSVAIDGDLFKATVLLPGLPST